MLLEIITPDEKVFEGEVDSASFPGSDGFFQILNGHAPLVSALRVGDLKFSRKVNSKSEITTIGLLGGVVEVLNNHIMVLADGIKK